ncbi:MAG: hypothetical protein MHMPM18_001364 [Marteilia pararefringens]
MRFIIKYIKNENLILLDKIIQIDAQVSTLVVSQLLLLQSEDAKKPIRMYINSPGGQVYAGLGIYDTMRHLTCPIHTYCIGLCASMASVLLCAGQPGHRFSLPNSKIMIHQPLGQFSGQASDFEIHAKEILGVRDNLCKIIASACKQKKEDVLKHVDRDNFMNPYEAKDYGIIDKILEPSIKG